MICRVNGKEVSCRALTYRELGFGGKEPWLEESTYSLTYTESEFIALLQEEYDEWMRHLVEDDKQFGDASPEYVRELNYPPIEVLLPHHEYLTDAVMWFFWMELLSNSLPDPEGAKVEWVVNSIESVKAESGNVEVTGRVFRKKRVNPFWPWIGRR